MTLSTTTHLQIEFHASKFIDISVDTQNGWVYANWKGTPTVDQVKIGLNLMLDAMIKYQVTKILNDNRELRGSWTGAIDWILMDWTPRARSAGYHGVAFIYSPDIFAQFSVDKMLENAEKVLGVVRSRPFKDIEEAKQWLLLL